MEDFVPSLNSLVKYSTPVLVSVAAKSKAPKPQIDANQSSPIKGGKGSSVQMSKVLPAAKQVKTNHKHRTNNYEPKRSWLKVSLLKSTDSRTDSCGFRRCSQPQPPEPKWLASKRNSRSDLLSVRLETPVSARSARSCTSSVSMNWFARSPSIAVSVGSCLWSTCSPHNK